MNSTLVNSSLVGALGKLRLFFLLHPPHPLLVQLLVLALDLRSAVLGIASTSRTAYHIVSLAHTPYRKHRVG